jgi:hypothetical protein
MLFEGSAAAAIATNNNDDTVAVSGTKSLIMNCVFAPLMT